MTILTKNDLQQIKIIVDSSVETKIRPITKQLNKIQRTVDTVIDHFDKRLTRAEKDVKVLQKN